MSIKSQEQSQSPTPQSISISQQMPSPVMVQSKQKGNYIGMTLMEYFKQSSIKRQLQEIDEESNSSVGAGTPFFGEVKEHVKMQSKCKKHRRDKMKTETEELLLPGLEKQQESHISKISTINFQEMGIFDKNIVKLPSINDHKRAVNQSRQGIIKEGKLFHRKEQKDHYKSKYQETVSLGKDFGRIHENHKNIVYKKSMRARVTSSSFYHANVRERERIKTEEEVGDRNLQKSFVVTKYGIGFMPKKKDEIIKKQQNTLKLLKNH